MPKIKALYLKAGVDEEPEVIEIENEDYKEFYKLIDCSTLDIVRRKIGDKMFFIAVDDEGLLKEKPVPSAFEESLGVGLVGNLIVTGIEETEDGDDRRSLTTAELATLKKFTFTWTRLFKNGERQQAKALLIGF